MIEIEHLRVAVTGGELHCVIAGQGQPLLLLHGWPQTWYEWRYLVPQLTAWGYQVIAPDLRGLGDSYKTASDFSKKAIAAEVVELLDRLLPGKAIDVAGHDWGGPVGFALALFYPERVRRLMIIDVVIPGDGRAGGLAQGGSRWHHLFHCTPSLPELLTEGRERIYIEWFLREYSHAGRACVDDALTEYARSYSLPRAMHNGFEYYRAAYIDAADNAQALDGDRLHLPVCCVAGASGRGRGTETFESLARVASQLQFHLIPQCGHLVPEERPQELARLMREFFNQT
jgi:pimeloyl-ACP methyl ester carboxylesterase